MKLVSVVMPYFKKERYVRDSISSILSQTYENLEIILIDDELSSESKDLLTDITKSDKRINLIKNHKNLGAGFSRNNAIKKSNGKYIAFCDCDDVWLENKLERQINFMEKNDYSFTFTAYQIINEIGKIIGSRNVKKKISFKDLIKSCDIGLSSVIVKKKIFEEKKILFTNLKTKEDYVLWLKLAKENVGLYGFQENLSYWRKTNNSLSSSVIQKLIDGYRVYSIHLGFNFFKSLFCLIILSLNFMLKRN